MAPINSELNEEEIDDLIIAHADDDDAWERPVFVNRKKVFSLVTPGAVEARSRRPPVFEGTDVTVSDFFDCLAKGLSLDDFLQRYPSVKREQALRLLEYLKATLDTFKQAA